MRGLGGSASMPSILLVDDSAVVRHAVARRLEAEGCEVREAGTLAEAKAVAAGPIDLAVIDVELPDGDGATLAADLRASRPTLPIAFYTAGTAPELVQASRLHGPVFAKPELEPLIAWVRARRG
jgi:two-component system response regulator PilR (NtrC family)